MTSPIDRVGSDGPARPGDRLREVGRHRLRPPVASAAAHPENPRRESFATSFAHSYGACRGSGRPIHRNKLSMILAKAPLRISLGGGGTDLPSYYSRFGSTFLSAAIDRYVYLAVHRTFGTEYIVKYSEVEVRFRFDTLGAQVVVHN